jgi:hypothetical protein
VEFDNPAFYAYLGKMLSQTLRLALLLHCIELKYEEKKDSLSVGIDTLERAITAAKFSIGQFRILQTNNHACDSLSGRLSLIHAYALRKGIQVSAVQVQNTVFKRCKPKPSLTEIRQDFATLKESGYAILLGKGKDLCIKAIPVQKARVGIPTISDPNSDPLKKTGMLTRSDTQPPLIQNSDNSDESWAIPISTAPETGELATKEHSNNAQNGRKCQNSDDDIASNLDAEPISDDEDLSEFCRNAVGNSDKFFEQDSNVELENDSDDDPDPDDDPSGGGNVVKPDTPPQGNGGIQGHGDAESGGYENRIHIETQTAPEFGQLNQKIQLESQNLGTSVPDASLETHATLRVFHDELFSTEEIAEARPDNRATETEQLIQQCLRLRQELQNQSTLVRMDERHSTFEQLQSLLTNYFTVRAIVQANSEIPAQNLVSLFTPLDNLLASWSIEPIGKFGLKCLTIPNCISQIRTI